MERAILVLVIATTYGFTSAAFLPLLSLMLRATQHGFSSKTIASVEELATVDVAVLHKTADSAFEDSEAVQLARARSFLPM